jgi:hypothetical protein
MIRSVTYAAAPRFGGEGDRALCFGCFQRAAVGGRRSGRGAARTEPPSSSGLGLRPFKAAARVRIPLGARQDSHKAQWRSWLARRPVTAEVAGSSPVWVAASERPQGRTRPAR